MTPPRYLNERRLYSTSLIAGGAEWFCFGCGALLHRVEIAVADIVKDLPPLFAAFYANVEARTCGSCGSLHPGKEPPPGWAALPVCVSPPRNDA